MEIKEAVKMNQDKATYKLNPGKVDAGMNLKRTRQDGDLLIRVYTGAHKERNTDVIDQINRAFSARKRGK
jgi:hypothetical protein